MSLHIRKTPVAAKSRLKIITQYLALTSDDVMSLSQAIAAGVVFACGVACAVLTFLAIVVKNGHMVVHK